jgi:hypothetical protein
MIFSSTFKMEFLASTTADAINLATTGHTYDLQAGVVGLFPTDPTGIISTAISTATKSDLTLAVGNWRTSDKIAPFAGGYKETLKSKRINLSLVQRFAHNIAHAPLNQKVALGWDMSLTGSTSDVGPRFYCGQTYTIKVTVLGSPAYRTFNKTLYNNFSAWGGCCTSGCATGCTSDYTDPVCILLQWKDRMYQTPEWCPTSQWPGYILPKVYWNDNGTKREAFSAFDVEQGRGDTAYVCVTDSPEDIVAGMEIDVAYTDTEFANCTFSLTDTYAVEPAYIDISLLTQEFDPCAFNTTINTSVPNMVAELQAPRQVKGSGNELRKQLILNERYLGNTFADSNQTMSLRMREIEDGGFNILAEVANSSLYDSVVIEHAVPRPRNRSTQYDTDYYTLIIHVPTGTDVTAFTDLFQDCLDAANSNVELVTLN